MPSIKLEDFKNALKDTIRPNRFFVRVGGNQPGGQWEEKFSFYVKSFVLPDENIGEIILNYQGMQAKIAGDPTFSDVSMTVHVDYAMKIKAYFEDYMEGIVSIGKEGDNIRSEPIDYKSVIKVDQLGRDGDTIRTYALVGAWPKNMNSVELNMDSTDTTSDMTVDWGIDYWYVE